MCLVETLHKENGTFSPVTSLMGQLVGWDQSRRGWKVQTYNKSGDKDAKALYEAWEDLWALPELGQIVIIDGQKQLVTRFYVVLMYYIRSPISTNMLTPYMISYHIHHRIQVLDECVPCRIGASRRRLAKKENKDCKKDCQEDYEEDCREDCQQDNEEDYREDYRKDSREDSNQEKKSK